MVAEKVKDWQLPATNANLDEMNKRLRATRYPTSICQGWSRGIELDYLQGFVKYLANDYDWNSDRQRFDGDHLMVQVDGPTGQSIGIHVNFPLGRIQDAQPLVLLHGWPSSGFEFVHLNPHLKKAGYCPIVVDLPGFGFSDPTNEPTGPRALAALIMQALGGSLGLKDMIVHGNDWGSTVASWMAVDHASDLRGIHLSMMGMKPGFSGGAPKPSEAELVWIKVVRKNLAADGGYREIQGTRPNTAAIGLTDSPAALAAWTVEKFHGWTGGGDKSPPSVARNDLAANVIAYWLSGNIASANWIYAAVHAHDDTAAPEGGTGTMPTGFSFFENGFFPPPPQSWAKRVHQVDAYNTHDVGGHYPALTQPEALATDIIAFLRGWLDREEAADVGMWKKQHSRISRDDCGTIYEFRSNFRARMVLVSRQI